MAIKGRIPADQDMLQNMLLESAAFSEFMLDLAVHAAVGLGSSGRVLCSITVEQGLAPATVASSAAEAMVLDERQYSLDDGPCLGALRGGLPVFVADLAKSLDWVNYANDIQSSGVAAIFAVPLAAGHGTGAALNCYAFDTATMDTSFRADVETLAASFSGILRLALRIHPLEPAGPSISSELDSRAVVDAAVGLLMIQDRCSREEAFGRLGRLAWDKQSKIANEAAGLLWQSKRMLGRG